MNEKRITQLDVARRAGVSRSAVSMAFKGDPGIPAATRERIRRIANEIGYSPDPMLTALASYRSRLRPPSFHGTLAWLVNNRGSFDWARMQYFFDYYEGARTAALRHGFQLELFDLAKRGMTPAKLAAIFRARNIAGLLVCPQPEAATEIADFPWQDFAAVTFGFTLQTPSLHTVASSQFHAAVRCVSELRAAGYRRIGFVLSREHVERTQLHYLGGYLAALEMAGLGGQVPPLMGEPTADSLLAWLDAHRPDAIVAGKYVLRFLQTLKKTVPGDLGFACPGLPDDKAETSGVWENSQHIGLVATDLLVSLLHRGERGLPAVPQRVLVEGTWIPGKTLRTVPGK